MLPTAKQLHSLTAVVTVAEHSPITARNGLSVNPDHTIGSCPKPDILLVPGGIGTRQELNNDRLIAWIKRMAADPELILSVCTGALLLGDGNRQVDGLHGSVA